jgi:anti-sigma regulatory factor (Ser/Thr protein kinase)
MSPRRRFAAAPASVGEARRFALHELPGASNDARERVELMVSELASNCVVHAATDFEVSMTWDEDVIRVEVTDTAGGQPSVPWPDPSRPKGRGLQIVSLLAERWGVEPSLDGEAGKTVWFTLGAPTPAIAPARRSRR